jgi:hypothetical protein
VKSSGCAKLVFSPIWRTGEKLEKIPTLFLVRHLAACFFRSMRAEGKPGWLVEIMVDAMASALEARFITLFGVEKPGGHD